MLFRSLGKDEDEVRVADISMHLLEALEKYRVENGLNFSCLLVTDIDTLIGGLGNDIYFVDQAEDQVVEAPGGGTDTVYASASYQLGAGEEIEYLRAFAAIGLELTGNEFDNEIIGGAGNKADPKLFAPPWLCVGQIVM